MAITDKQEYNLSYSAAEIDRKLTKVDGFSVEFTNVNANLSRMQDELDTHTHTISEVEKLQDTLNELNNKIITGGSGSSGGLATQYTNGLMSAEDKEQLDYGGTPIVNAPSTNGVSYTATVDGINELKVGAKITIIPQKTSTSKTPTLNVNNLGAKYIRMPIAGSASDSIEGTTTGWLVINKPITVKYDGTYWLTIDLIGAAPMYTYGTEDIAAGSASSYPTGTLHFIYEEVTE